MERIAVLPASGAPTNRRAFPRDPDFLRLNITNAERNQTPQQFVKRRREPAKQRTANDSDAKVSV